MSQHPFNPNPALAIACLDCGKGRTHTNHSGMGEIEPNLEQIEREMMQAQAERPQEIHRATPAPIQSFEDMPDTYFRIESVGDGVEIGIVARQCDPAVAIAALQEFLEKIKPQAEEPEPPAPRKKK